MPDADYMREYRKRNPDYARSNRLKAKARALALERLRMRHAAEYDQLFGEAQRELHRTASR